MAIQRGYKKGAGHLRGRVGWPQPDKARRMRGQDHLAETPAAKRHNQLNPRVIKERRPHL